MSAVVLGEETRATLAAGRGVVALETSVVGQGLPHPRNEECVARMERAIRVAGAVPAWTGTDAGRLVVGLDAAALARMATPGIARKVARRDLAAAMAAGVLGATTVSATLHAASLARIAVAATGGIGGVHRGPTRDVSADLLELARTPGLLVCSGAKSIVDPIATADLLEELGVPLVGYGVDRMPAFLVREGPAPLPHRVDDAARAAAILAASYAMASPATVLLCNPIPASAAMEPGEVEAAVAAAEAAATAAGVHGPAVTPFLLARMAEVTGGRSLEANLALLEDNARVAGEVAAAFAAAGGISAARS